MRLFMAFTLYPKLIALCAQHPEVARYRRRIVGGCCQKPNDQVLRRRIEIFLITVPDLRPLLESIL